MAVDFHHLDIGSEPIPGYRLVRKLGEGSVGRVWEAEAPGGVSKAIKIVPLDNNTLTGRELEGLQRIKSIRHPFLLAVDRFEEVSGHLITVMELAGESLLERCVGYRKRNMPGIPRPELLGYLKEVAEVLDLLSHEHGLQHLDIKPTNILLSGGHVKVADFGLLHASETTLNDRMLAFSPLYAAPELFEGTIHRTADLYSLAVTFLELLVGDRPYSGTTVVDLLLQMNEHPPNLTKLPEIEQAVVARALSRNPEHRFSSCHEFVHTLSNPENYARVAPQWRTTTQGKESKSGLFSPTRSSPMAVLRARGNVAEGKSVLGTPAPDADLMPAKSTSRSKRLLLKAKESTPNSVNQDRVVHASFLAILPLEVYALKLRGFMDAISAEAEICTERKTILRLDKRNWFGLRQGAVFIRIDTLTQRGDLARRVVDATVWTTIKNLDGQRLAQGGLRLIRCLKSFLMATETNNENLNVADVKKSLLA